MILSHTYKFVCLNPPKTGSGFREALLRDHSDISISKSSLRRVDGRHWNVAEASKYIRRCKQDPENYYWFTFVRNPWERIISWYNMMLNHALKRGETYPRDIEEFIHQDILIDNKQRLLNEYIYRDGKLLDFIGSLENITEDMSFVLNELDISVEIGSREDTYIKDFKQKIKSQLSPDMIDLIADVEKDVIELKKYTFSKD